MQRERRTLSVPTISYEDVDQQQDLEMAQQQPHGVFLTPPSPQLQPLGVSGGPAGGSGGSGAAGSAAAGWASHPPGHPGLPSPLGHGQSATLGKPHHTARSRSSSTSSLTPSATGPAPNPQKKKIVTACLRCRTRKIRCDGTLPACRSCVKAGVNCIEVDRTGDNNMPRSHVLELENRIKWLEKIVETQLPDFDLSAGPPVDLRSRPSPPAIRIVTTGPDFDQQSQSISSTSSPVYPAFSPSSTCATPVSFEFSSPGVSPGYLQPMSPFTFSDHGRSPTPSPGPSSPLLLAQDTLSHEVGLLSLTASEEPRFLGASSGINFARMVFSDVREDFQPPEERERDIKRNLQSAAAEPAPLPSPENCHLLSTTYFETVHLAYPFLHQPTFEQCLAYTLRRTQLLTPGFSPATARFHVFLVLGIGAQILSSRSGRDWNAAGYTSAAMGLMDEVSFAGSLLAAQNTLLLAMSSLYAPPGCKVWYLSSLIMATCIDLGLHRKCQLLPGEQAKAALRRRVFWCAYSLDRNLSTALGRPFSIRDEAINVDLPSDTDNDEELSNLAPLTTHALPPSIAASRTLFANSILLFQLTRLTSSIKTTLYRLSNPDHTPWAVDLSGWELKAHQHLHELQEQFRTTNLRNRGPTTTPAAIHAAQLVELKLHEATQLLFRPRTPYVRHSAPFPAQQIFRAAVDTIRLLNRSKRYPEPPHPPTRLLEHAVFLAGITMLYAHRTCREVRESASNEFLAGEIRACSSLLAEMAGKWPTAGESRARFDALAQATLAYSAATSSARMLSPHGAGRRASVGSGRGFGEQLGVPGMVWYGGVEMGAEWMGGWDAGMAAEDIMISGMGEGAGGGTMEMLGLMEGDSAMWGMEGEEGHR